MDFEGFLADCRRQWPGFEDEHRLADSPHPADRRLARLPDEVPGYATENKLMLLNLAVRHMDPGEVYVEVGTWRGLSAIGAARGNEDRRLFVCDDFSKLGCSRDALEANLRDHCPPGQVEVHGTDYREFLRSAPWEPARVGAYFYDGAHHFRHQLRALQLIEPYLAEDAIIIIDDTDDLPVRAANELFRRHVPAFEPLLDVRSPGYKHPYWWNGVQVFRWRGDAGGHRRSIPARSYLPRLLLWSRAVVYGQRLLHYARAAASKAAGVLTSS